MADNSDSELVDLAALHQPSYQVATIMYRLAVARCHRARRKSVEHAETGKSDRQMREMDVVIETIVLAQAACESWIFFAYRHTGTKPGSTGGWVQRWIDGPRLICDRNQPASHSPTRDLDDATVATLRQLSDWRNFLVHNDDSSRDRLQRRIGADPDVRLLTAEMAEQTIMAVDQAFADLGSLLGVHGVHGLSSDHLWVDYDER